MDRKTNATIDIMKFIAAIIIMIHHSNKFFLLGDSYGIFPRGSLFVEFFFAVTGLFVIERAIGLDYSSGVKEDASYLGKETCSYLKKKFVHLFPYVLVSLVTSLVFYASVYHYGPAELAETMILTIPDLFLLQGFGFTGKWIIGVTWFLSVMFIVLMILYPLTIKWKRNITLIVSPIVTLFIYGLFSHYYGCICNPGGWFESLHVMDGLLRGFAGLFVGGFIYELSLLWGKHTYTKDGKHILSIIEWGGYIAVCLMCFLINKKTNADFIIVLLIYVSLSISFSKKGFITEKLMGKDLTILRRISISMFLSHMVVADIISQGVFLRGMEPGVKLICYLLISIGLTAINMLVGGLLSKLHPVLRLKKIVLEK